MKKIKVFIEGEKGKKLNEGDLVFSIQANRDVDGYDLLVNMDWQFDDNATNEEIRAMLGRFFGNIEEVFGEKMMTEAILHYAEENGHLVKTQYGATLNFKSKGLDFKNWKKGGN